MNTNVLAGNRRRSSRDKAFSQRRQSAVGDREAAFEGLHAQHCGQLAAFISMLVPIPQDAEEVLQETCLVCWNKFDEYQQGSNFVAWAKRIAFFEVLKFRRRRKNSLLQLSEEVLDLLTAEEAKTSDETAGVMVDLDGCVQRLSPRDQEVLRIRYESGGSAQRVADALDRPVDGVFRSLRRIRDQLRRCIAARAAKEISDEVRK
jgi:RNA polymerase sigma-70 factor (ECF subfamily)